MVAAALFALAAFLPALRGAQVDTSEYETMRANPVRKVITMLQTMQKKVEAEGKEEEEAFEKFMCYCKTSGADLTTSITAAESSAPQITSAIEEAEGAKAQLEADLKGHSADRDAAKASIAEANAIRGKEAAAYAASSSDHTANIAALNKAVAALEKGMAGAFLQTTSAQVVQKLVETNDNIIEEDRQMILAFLQGRQASGYSPQSGEITGLLKQIGDEMSKTLAEETSTEEASIADHTALVAAKSKEIAAHTSAIEAKTVRHGETAVNIVNMKNDLSDTQEALLQDKAFLKELETGCSTKEAEWSERKQTRADELVALSETIKLLSDDDALELFKKAVPAAGASFVQMGGTAARQRARALAVLRAARAPDAQRVGLDLIALALQGKTKGKSGGFEKVIAMIDDMVGVLKKEQVDDDNKKEYCALQLDKADDKKKALESTAASEDLAKTTAEESVATLAEEIKALAAGIAALDKSVAEATEQRKTENAEYTELITMNTQAKDLLGVAKNRLNKFYNPSQYLAPPKKELTQEEYIYQSVVPASSFVQVSLHSNKQRRAAPPPPPETFDAYTKKTQETNGVIAMIDMLIKDIEKETTEAETSEKDAQEDYEKMLADAKSKRAADSKAMTGKESAKAGFEEEAQTHKDAHSGATKELMATAEYIHGLHSECDWLVDNYENRKSARAGEMESLANAKSVLSGADYSFVQLRGSQHQ